MKKAFLLLVSVTAAALLGGCGAAPAPPPQADAPPALSETLPPPPPEEEVILYTVSTTTEENTIQTDDGVVLLSSRFQLPVLTVLGEDGSPITEAETPAQEQALLNADTFNRKFTDWSSSASIQDVSDMAKEDYAWYREGGYDWHSGYVLELNCTAYQTERMVSVFGLYYSFTGGAHPNSVYLAWNFDLENGAFFDPEFLGSGPELQEAVAKELIRQCGEHASDAGMAPEDLFWQDYETIVSNWSSYAVSFDGEGMTVCFSPYELAAYAAGPQIFEVSYDFLEPYLSEQGRAILGLDT